MALIVAGIEISEYKDADGRAEWQAYVGRKYAVSSKSARDAARRALRFVDDSGTSRIDAWKAEKAQTDA